jgi:hypothetical protein
MSFSSMLLLMICWGSTMSTAPVLQAEKSIPFSFVDVPTALPTKCACVWSCSLYFYICARWPAPVTRSVGRPHVSSNWPIHRARPIYYILLPTCLNSCEAQRLGAEAYDLSMRLGAGGNKLICAMQHSFLITIFFIPGLLSCLVRGYKAQEHLIERLESDGRMGFRSHKGATHA